MEPWYEARRQREEAQASGRVQVVMTDDGKANPHVKRKWGKETLTPMSKFDILLDGAKIGTVERGLATFERAPRGSRIVTKRWSSPRWFFYLDGEFRRSSDNETKKEAIKGLVQQHFLRQLQAAEEAKES